MPIEMPAVKTPVSKEAMLVAMALGWNKKFGEPPNRNSVLLLLSHWAFETGHGNSMWCFNLGNVKAKVTGAYDYCFFACDEILPAAQAERLAAATPETAKIKKRRSDGTCIIQFYPKHPACCFRAFTSLDDGVTDHLDLIHKRFKYAWPFVVAGDVSGFCKALKQQRYYTADEAAYTRGVVGVFSSYSAAFSNVQLHDTSCPVQEDIPTVDYTIESSLLTPLPEEECEIYSPQSILLA